MAAMESAPSSSLEHLAFAGGSSGKRSAKDRNRSRVTNSGGNLLPNIDNRSALARRFRDICSAIAADQGGADRLSEARLQLVRRFSAAAVLAEGMEARLANGEEIDIAQHALLCSTLTRLAQRIGIDRRLRNVLPSVEEYLAASAKQAIEIDADDT